MTLDKNDLKKVEIDVVALKSALNEARNRIRETGGSEIKLWCFRQECRIRDIENKIAELKTGKIRTDELTSEDTEIEKHITRIETNLKIKAV